MSLFIVQGRAEMLEGLREDERFGNDSEFQPCWTCPSTVKRGDGMLIYLMRPVSAIVGHATFSSEPFMNNDFDSEWFGKRMSTFIGLKVFDESEFISLFHLHELFPQWHWATRPQGAVKVPEIYEKEFLKLILIK